MPVDDTRMTIGEHIDELRRCLIRALAGVAVGMIVCFIFRGYLWAIISWPLSVATMGNPPPMQTLAPSEGFATLLKLCMIVGAILSSPYGLYQMWTFIGAGLYENERRAIKSYLLPSMLLFLLGVVFFFCVVAPIVLGFFLDFTRGNYAPPPGWMVDWLGEHFGRGAPAATQPTTRAAYVQSQFRVTDYVSFVAVLSLVFGAGFQTPLVVIFLVRTGLVPVAAMRRYRPHVFLVILLVAAFITPPDVLSQVALGLPMYGLYEIGLIVAARGKRKADAR